MNEDRVIDGWFGALCRGNAEEAARFLSPSFGINAGLCAHAYIDWELREFRERSHLLSSGYSVKFLRDEGRGKVFGVFDGCGRFLFEDEYCFGSDGLLVGNQRECDVVTKFHFVRGREPMRALCIPDARVRHARVVDPLVRQQLCGLGALGSSMILKFVLRGDDLGAHPSVVRLMFADRVCSTEVVFRGIRSPYFVDDMYARIDGSRVMVPVERGNIWSLTVVFMDGSAQEIGHPDRSIYLFAKPVSVVYLTDALDNDWETTGNGF